MDIIALANRSLSVYITNDELEKSNLEPAGITYNDIYKFILPVLKHPCGDLCFEIFPGRSGVMAFIRSTYGNTEIFSFDDSEALIEAVSCIPDDESSSLFFYEGKYILVILPFFGDNISILSEFGQKLDLPARFISHIAEHGRTIIRDKAVETIRTSLVSSKNHSKDF